MVSPIDFEHFAGLGFAKVALSVSELQTAAADTDPNPTEQEKETGDYEKGKVSWQDLVIVIETAAGAKRSGTDENGKPWSITMQDCYGYFEGMSSQADDDDIDVFICEDDLKSEIVFVVNQNDAAGKFDEHKAVIGCTNEARAREVYLRNYSKGWDRLGSIKAMTLADFKDWMKAGDTSKKASTVDGEDFWQANEKRKKENQTSRLPHVRDGYILCDGCNARYHVMPDDSLCPKCDYSMQTRLRGMKRAEANKHLFTVAVDLDGTIAKSEPDFDPKSIGDPITQRIEFVRKFKAAGARIIIFTVRGTTELVRTWLTKNNVPFDYINENPDQPPNSSGKIIADVYWDDRAENALDPQTGQKILDRITRELPQKA